ncbi:glycosyltransferase family 2 protein [Dysgonomonas macrotermitis]|uniref:Glycosyltransferase 2-like domain-containing protein n=1 Tax=Dysgonomonas macrotermitis TaxID=1346286 RepID=A0A1M5E3E7_9BACT|nr:glycosyltransferase family 2 protein [Dysgonomonas macrotermitis]SHF73690.1 hypothetical protein SAMN05444362_109135 [Dysgonomonas macrotermitis]
METHLQVSIIIVNYNTDKLLEDCILSVKEKTHDLNYEIIVIDNDSEKGSLSHLIEKFPGVQFHFSNQNLGFGKANNLGSTLASGKYLFFLNPDTLLINNAAAILYDYMEKHPQVGICGGNMYRENMIPASSLYDTDFLTYEYKIIFNIKRVPGFNYTKEPKETRVIVGADLFMPKNIFEELNGFDPDFFMYFEEVELCYRARKAGYKIISVPDAEIIHLQGGSAENKSEELNKWSYREHWYSKFLFFYKTKGLSQTRTVYNIYRLKLNIAILLFSLKKNQSKIEYWKTKGRIMQDTYDRFNEYLSRKTGS